MTWPDLNLVKPCSVKMWLPSVNFLTLEYKTNHEFSVTTARSFAVVPHLGYSFLNLEALSL